MKCSPMAMMAIPAAIDSASPYWRSSVPKAEAVAPSATNTVENPATNSRLARKAPRRERAASPPCSSSSVVPAMKHR